MEKNSQTLTISQISTLLNVSKPTLRFWEKEFAGILVPMRTDGGQRRYTSKHVEIVNEIRSLKKAGLSLDEIRATLNGKIVWNLSDHHGIDNLAERVADMVRREVVKYLERHAGQTMGSADDSVSAGYAARIPNPAERR